MRVWVAFTLLVLLLGAIGPADGHHSGPTAGIIRNGPDSWDVEVGRTVTQTLEGQLHADGDQDILVGVPNGFPDCPGCRSDWVHVELTGTDPPLLHDATRHFGHVVALDNASWPYDEVLRVRFTVTFRIGDDAPDGTLPFDLGIRTMPATCDPDRVCLGAGAVSRVHAYASPRPVVTITSPADGTITAQAFTVNGTNAAPHPIVRTTLQLDERAPIELAAGTDFSHSLGPNELTAGTHRITVSGTDSVGRTGHDTIRVHIDHETPTVELLSPRPHHIYVSGVAIQADAVPSAVVIGPTPVHADATDDIDVHHVRLCIHATDNTTIRCSVHMDTPYEDRDWHRDLPPGRYRISARAVDHVGNASPIDVVDIIYLPQP